MNFLGSPLWSGIGVIMSFFVGIIAVILTVVQINRSRNRKIFAYDVVSAAPVVTVNKEVESRVKILFDGKPIEDAALAVIEVLNAGDVPINVQDYATTNIEFDFGEGAEVLNTDLLAASPEGWQQPEPSLTPDSGKVLLKPLMLNPQDSFTFKALVTGLTPSRKLQVGGRISGVKRIVRIRELPRNVRRTMLVRMFLPTTIVFTACIILALIGAFLHFIFSPIIYNIFMFAIFAIIVFHYLYIDRVILKKKNGDIDKMLRQYMRRRFAAWW